MAISTVGLFSFTFLAADTPIYRIVGSLVVIGIGFGLFSSPNTNAIMGSVEKRFYGVASAMVSTMRLVGQMLSMGLVLMVFAIQIGSARIVPANYPALQISIDTVFSIGTAAVLHRHLHLPGTGEKQAGRLDISPAIGLTDGKSAVK